jgi:MATE family multidrug resistance protein
MVAVLMSLTYFLFGDAFVSMFTNLQPVRVLAVRYLPWAIAMPSIAVWGFQLDGIFNGATRARDLRDSMLISFLGYLGLAIAMERWLSNDGLWLALVCFMVLRGTTLGLRLPGIERSFAAGKPEPVVA